MRISGALIILACAACPGGTGGTTETTDTAATTEPNGTTSGSETADPPTGTTTAPAPTTSAGTTTEDPTTGDPTTGEPAQPSARVVYVTALAPRELFFVDCTGETPGAPIRIHEPLAEGWEAAPGAWTSPSGRWLVYNLVHPELGREAWLVDMSGPLPGVPKRVELPAGMSLLFRPQFSHDETRLALWGEDADGSEFHLCTIEPDGTCVPERWGVPLQPGGIHRFSFEFSPDDTRVAYFADPEGDGSDQLFLGGTAPGEAGVAVPVSGDMPPVDQIETLWFSQDGATLYYGFGPDPSRPGVRAVDVASDPPKAPVTVVPIDGLFAVHPDESAMLGWSSEDDSSNGDLAVFALDGTKVGPGAPIHDAPGRVSDRLFQWSADGRFVIYGAHGGQVENAYALFGADVSGPTPTPPVILSAPITTNGTVDRVLVGPDPSVVFYVGRPDLETGDQVWRVPLEAPGDRVLLAEMAELGTILDVRLGPDGSQVLFSALPEWKGQHQLFLADPAAPGAPVHLSEPLEPDEGVRQPQFSQDGGRVFYFAHRAVDDTLAQRLLQVDVDAPDAVVQVSDPAHSVGQALYFAPVAE
ncbi:hypothetical protein OV090_07815 [Nannocystis sp. RBIL2]|uniref:hypothetical protein n=1 Tax=Nannocystis sp. RBIL2 TaxID=2996788 RepID=UPI00226DA55D|nr:hypothetical protein [Nannocystis sp. RBIL2]MCY1064663.1 hypothetical protein [Nannocystis sp. RBIL2]